MILKVKPDRQKAKALFEMAKTTLKRLKETNAVKYPSNTLNDYYDIIRKLMETLLALEGVKIKGEGAHAKIIDYICKKYELGMATRLFLQQMRDYRNRIAYEGFHVTSEYITQNSNKIEKIINQFIKKAQIKL